MQAFPERLDSSALTVDHILPAPARLRGFGLSELQPLPSLYRLQVTFRTRKVRTSSPHTLIRKSTPMTTTSATSRSQRSAAWSSSLFNTYSCVVVLALVVGSFTAPAAATRTGAGKWLEVGFYRNTCPDVEGIVYDSMLQSYRDKPSVAPGVLRIAFHDCFVRGCDASVLLLGPDTERAAASNKGLRGFEAVDAAKAAVEKACPGVVSAADVLQFAARDAVVLAGGQGWDVPAGRRDGRVSRMADANDDNNLPTATITASQLLELFLRKGLNADQLVVLAGAHTIGQAPCIQVDNRIHVSPVDPMLAPDFAASLQKQCPNANDVTTLVDLDSTTAGRFDTQYFKGIVEGRGLLTSDQSLMANDRTKGAVYSNSEGDGFYKRFGKAMVAMSSIEVLTGWSGEIRRNISHVN